MAINNRHDFHAFSAFRCPNPCPATLGHHKRRVDEAFFFIHRTSVAKLVSHIRQQAPQHLIAAPSLKAPMYRFVVGIALRQHMPLRTCVEKPQDCFKNATCRDRLASGTTIGNVFLGETWYHDGLPADKQEAFRKADHAARTAEMTKHAELPEHDEFLWRQAKKITVVSDEMRAVVESEWPELAHKLPPKDDGLHIRRTLALARTWPRRASGSLRSMSKHARTPMTRPGPTPRRPAPPRHSTAIFRSSVQARTWPKRVSGLPRLMSKQANLHSAFQTSPSHSDGANSRPSSAQRASKPARDGTRLAAPRRRARACD